MTDPLEDGQGFEYKTWRFVLGTVIVLAELAYIGFKVASGLPFADAELKAGGVLTLFAAGCLLPPEMLAALLPWRK
jgi:hypothetical protein